jgi:hypothetical protein
MYGHATNTERFAGLHHAASEILKQLESGFDVDLTEGYDLDAALEKPCELARPTILVEPRDIAAAPAVFVFTTFPGLLVRLGKWYTTAFPVCGCDACAETLSGEVERLQSRLDDVIAGRFRETIRVADLGAISVESEFWSMKSRSTERSWAKLDIMPEILEIGKERDYWWRAWPRLG